MGPVDLPALLLGAARWVVALSAVLLCGTLGASLVVRSARGGSVAAIRHLILGRLARSGLVASTSLVVGLVLMLAAQTFAWFGPDGFRGTESVRVMVFDTAWGHNWASATIGASAALLLTVAAGAFRSATAPLLAMAALTAAVSAPLIGHGASHGNLIWLTHAGHVFGAGLWMGGLAVLMRATWLVWVDEATPPDALLALLAAFSPVALAGAAALAISGAVLALEHVQPVDSLWETAYGRVLSTKILIAGVIVALGWRNWRRFGPGAAEPAVRARLRRAALLECGLGLGVVLAITAWLAGLPVPVPTAP